MGLENSRLSSSTPKHIYLFLQTQCSVFIPNDVDSRQLIRLHTAPSGATKGFIQMCSHYVIKLPLDLQTVCVKSVEFPFKRTHQAQMQSVTVF